MADSKDVDHFEDRVAGAYSSAQELALALPGFQQTLGSPCAELAQLVSDAQQKLKRASEIASRLAGTYRKLEEIEAWCCTDADGWEDLAS